MSRQRIVFIVVATSYSILFWYSSKSGIAWIMHATAAINRLIVTSHAVRKLRQRRSTHVQKPNDED